MKGQLFIFVCCFCFSCKNQKIVWKYRKKHTNKWDAKVTQAEWGQINDELDLIFLNALLYVLLSHSQGCFQVTQMSYCPIHCIHHSYICPDSPHVRAQRWQRTLFRNKGGKNFLVLMARKTSVLLTLETNFIHMQQNKSAGDQMLYYARKNMFNKKAIKKKIQSHTKTRSDTRQNQSRAVGQEQ